MSNFGERLLQHMKETTLSNSGAEPSLGNLNRGKNGNRALLHSSSSKGDRRRSIDAPIKRDSSTLIRELSFDTGLVAVHPKRAEIEQEVWNVKMVRNDFVSVSKPSAAIERLLAKRKKLHEEAIDEMKDELAVVYQECENEFRGRSTRLKIEINNIRQEIEHVKDQLREIDLLILREEDCNKAWEKVERLNEGEKKLIDKFYEHLKDIEKKRLDSTKPIMQKYYNILHKISHLLPYEIQTELENQILHYNQAVLGNHRTYADLHLQLQLIADTAKMKFKDWVEELKIDSRDAIRVNTLRVFELEKRLLKDTETIFLSREEGRLATFELASKDNLILDIISGWEDVFPFSCGNVAEWSVQLHEAVMSIDKCARYLVSTYKELLTKIFNGYYNQVEDFKIMGANKYDTFEQDAELAENMLKSVKNKHEKVISNLEDLWEEILGRMQSSLRDTYAFLQDSGRVWERHIKRLAEAQKLVSQSLDDTIARNDRSNQALETKLNIEIDKMWQEFDEDRMEKLLNGIYTILDSIRDKYTSDFQDECTAIKVYRELVERELPVLDAETEQFFHMYPKESIKKDIAFIPRDSVESPTQKIIPKQLRMCEYQVSAVMNWKFGIMEMFNTYRSHSDSDILNTARIWEKDKIEDCAKRLEIKLGIHSHRYSRIRMEIFDARIDEVRTHFQRLQRHKLGVNEALDNMSEELKTFNNHLKQFIFDYQSELAEIMEKVYTATTSFTVKRFKAQINALAETYEYAMEHSASEFQDEATNKFSWIRETTASLIRAIKLFNESGNFGNEEAKEFCKSLASCKKSVAQRQSTIFSSINRNQKEMTPEIAKKSKEAIYYVDTLIQDLLFREEIMNCTRKCSSFLKHEALHLFNMGEKLTDDCNHLFEMYRNNMNETLPLQPIKDNWIRVLNNAYDMLKYVGSALPTLDMPASGRYDLKEKGLTQGNAAVKKGPSGAGKKKESSIASKKGKGTKAKPVAKLSDYRSLLFGSNEPPPHKEDQFGPIVMNNLWETFLHIQDRTMAHFSSLGGREITKPDLMEPSYPDFMEEILLKLQYYYLQVKAAWEINLKGLLPVLDKLKKNTYKWILNCFNQFDEGWMPQLIMKKEDIDRLVHRAIVIGYRKRNEMTASLKIMHGYPGNKDLLKELSDRVLKTEEEMRKTIIDNFESLKNKFDEQFQMYEPALNEVSDQLQVVFDKCHSLDDAVAEQNLVRLLPASDLSRKSSFSSGKQERDSDERNLGKSSMKSSKRNSPKELAFMEVSIISPLEELVEKPLEIPDQHRISLPQQTKCMKLKTPVTPKSTIARKNTSKILDPRISLGKKYTVARSISLTMGVGFVADSYMEKCKEAFSSGFLDVDEEVQSFLSDGEEFRAVWEHNVKLVTRVYDVRYVCEDDLTEKIKMESSHH